MSDHGTYETVDGRPALRFERTYQHPVEEVWRAVTELNQLAQWFPSTVDGEMRAGGRLRFSFPEHESVDDIEGEVLELEPPRRLAFTWGDDELRFALEPVGDGGCTLHFTHLLDEREKAARDAAGWHVILAGLERTLAGQSGGRAAGVTPDWRERYEEYERRGLPTGAPIPT